MASSTRSHRAENLGEKVPAVIGAVSGDSQDGEDQSCVNSGVEESIRCQECVAAEGAAV